MLGFIIIDKHEFVLEIACPMFVLNINFLSYNFL